MRCGIVGPGALGTFLSGMIGRKNQVVLSGHKDLSIDEVEIKGKTELRTKITYTTQVENLSDVEYILICTKSFQTERAMKEMHEYISPDTMLVSLQNGLKNEKVISRFVGEDRVIGGITEEGITFERHGKVIHAGEGKTVIGPYSDDIPDKFREKIKRFSGCLNEVGISNRISDNIYGHIWKKVIINAGINPVTAITGLKNGAIIKHNNLMKLLENICEEAEKVAKNEVKIPGESSTIEAKNVAKMTADNKSSMLQDIENQRRTEIDCINGAIVSVADRYGIEVPFNRAMVYLVKGLEDSYLHRSD